MFGLISFTLLVKKILPLLLVLFIILSCDNKKETLDNSTWISGQIVNPKLDYIIFGEGSLIMDTVKLDSNNFFIYRTDKIKEGLYSLRHNETQVFYIEPGDSLLLHLNTLEFDESLAYSGKGAARNNFLMDLYLRNERENTLLPKWYSLSAADYTRKIDSIKAEKEKIYQDFLSKNEVSDGFREVAEASIKYDNFSKKELYAMANRSKADVLEETYFNYRKDIDFNNEKLRFYYPYYRFLNRYFNSLTISKFPPGTDRNSYDFSIDKLKSIDSMVSNDSIRNSLMRITAFHYLSTAKDSEEESKFYTLFEKLNNNPNHIDQINQLTEATKKIARGNKISNIQLLTMDNNVKDLHSIITGPSVLYFWTALSPSQAKMVHSRAAELKSKYPEYSFIGINTDSHFKKWRNTVKNMGFKPDKEFQLENLNDAKRSLVLSPRVSKSIILDKNGMILDGNTNMFNSNFEQLLLGFLNQ